MPGQAPFLTVTNLHVAFDSGSLMAIDDVSFSVAEGEFVCLLGPSGCGKSTVLNAIAGFITPSGGTIALDGRAVRDPGPERGVVFQSFGLFPWKTVFGNVEFGLSVKGVPKPEREERVMEILTAVQLEDRRNAYPHQLSGGMQQRVAIARALLNDPKVLLMDEPFGSLDAQTRSQMQQWMLELWQRDGLTVIFVTHDIDEAIILSERILVLSARPAVIRAEIPVDLPRPRTEELSLTSEYAKHKYAVMQAFRDDPLQVSPPSRAPTDGDQALEP